MPWRPSLDQSEWSQSVDFDVIGFRCYVDLSRRRVVAVNVEVPPNVASPC